MALASFGTVFTLFAYQLMANTAFTALGFACIVLGATLALTPPTPIPKLSVRALVEGGVATVEALLEEFEVEERAVYLPPRENRPYAIVPLSSNPGHVDVGKVVRRPLRVVNHVDGTPILTIFPPASEVVRLSDLSAGAGLEDGVRLVLVDFVEGAESVKVVRTGKEVVVEIVNPLVKTDFPRFKRVMGSLAASIAGCALATALDSPVVFRDEQVESGRVRAVFEVAE